MQDYLSNFARPFVAAHTQEGRHDGTACSWGMPRAAFAGTFGVPVGAAGFVRHFVVVAVLQDKSISGLSWQVLSLLPAYNIQ